MAPHDNTLRSLRCVLDLGVGTRGPRIAWAAMHTRACAATGWRTPCLKFVAPHGLRLPGDKGDERSTVAIGRCSASVRRGVRGGVRGDLGWWSRNVGQEGRYHLLYGELSFGAPLMLCVLLLKCALSGTLAFLRHHNCHLAQDKTVAVRSAVALSAPVCGNATHGSTSRRIIGVPVKTVLAAFG